MIQNFQNNKQLIKRRYNMKKIYVNCFILLTLSNYLVSCSNTDPIIPSQKRTIDMVIGKMNNKDIQDVFKCFFSIFNELKANDTLRIINPEGDGKREVSFEMGVDNITYTQKKYKFKEQIKKTEAFFKQSSLGDTPQHTSLINMRVLTSYLERNIALNSDYHDVFIFGKPYIPIDTYQNYSKTADENPPIRNKIRYHILLVTPNAYNNDFSIRQQLLQKVCFYIQQHYGDLFTFETAVSEMQGRLNNSRIEPYRCGGVPTEKSVVLRLEWDNIGQTDLDLIAQNNDQVLCYKTESGKVSWGEHSKSSIISNLKRCWEEIKLYHIITPEELMNIKIEIIHDNGQPPQNAMLQIQYNDEINEKTITNFIDQSSYKNIDKPKISWMIKDLLMDSIRFHMNNKNQSE